MGSAVGIVQKDADILDFNVKLTFQSDNISPKLPSTFILRLDNECVDIVEIGTDRLLCNVIYTDIDSWTTGLESFTMNLKHGTNTVKAKLTVGLTQGQERILAVNILSGIKKLMARMELEGYTFNIFPEILKALVDERKGELKSDWIELLGTTKKLTAFQALDIYDKLHSESEFDRMDSICHLYSLLLDNSMFQLLVNALENDTERDNVLHRLMLKRNKNIAGGAITLTVARINSVIVAEILPLTENAVPPASITDSTPPA
jgi:hypothetical protein